MNFSPPDDCLLSRFVTTYRFWDVVVLWARERLEHEEVVARALASGIIRSGLAVSEYDPDERTVSVLQEASISLRAAPWTGYRATDSAPLLRIRAATLSHLIAIVEHGLMPSRNLLFQVTIAQEDFGLWADTQEIPRPSFWFSSAKRTT